MTAHELMKAANSYELEIIHLLNLFAPNNSVVQDMVNRTLKPPGAHNSKSSKPINQGLEDFIEKGDNQI